MNVRIHHVVRLSCLMFAVSLFGCDGKNWPPGESELRDNYFSNQELFFRVAEILNKSGYTEVHISRNSEGARIALETDAGKSLLVSTKKNSIELNRILQQLNLESARIVNGQLLLDTFTGINAGTYFRIVYIAFSTNDTPIMDHCGHLRGEVPKSGACLIALDQSWRLEFNWWEQR